MNQLKELFSNLTMPAKLSVAAAVLAVGGGLYYFTMMKKDTDYRILYTRMSPEDTAAIAAKLKESQVDYKTNEDGTAILVPSSALASSRLTLAGAGLPKSGRIGFELFDKTNLTATDFAEHVNFARALEGELERSILLIEEVERTRVHITFPKESVFVESRQPAKASVVIGTRPGKSMSAASVAAVRNLVASAVQGLAPDSVAVVDVRGQLLGKPKSGLMMADGTPGDEFTEYRTGIEKEMTAKLSQALAPVLGEGKFRAGVTVDCDYASREESEEALDPERTIKLSEHKSEENANSTSTGGVPGTSANLPGGGASRIGGGGGSSRKTENSTYAPTRQVKLVKRPRGEIKRLSVAIVVDQDLQYKGSGPKRTATLVPPSAEKLKVIKDVASSILGIQSERGDQITVESLAFEGTLEQYRHPAEEVLPEKTNPLVPKILQPVVSDNPAILMQAGALLLLLAMSISGFVMWKKYEKKRKVEKALEAAEARATIEAANEVAAAEERLALEAAHAEQVSTSLANLQEIAAQLRIQIGDDPRVAALAVRHMLAQHE